MAIAFVQSKVTNTGAGTSASVDLVFDGTPVAGNIIVIASAGTAQPYFSATGIDFWAVARTAVNNSACALTVGTVQASPGATITATLPTAQNLSLVGAEYSGISLSLDQAVSAIGSSTTPSSGATDTTLSTNELWLGAVAQRNTAGGSVFSLPLNSFAIVDQTNTTTGTSNVDRAVVLLSRIVSATGTVTAACTSSVANNWAAIALSLK